MPINYLYTCGGPECELKSLISDPDTLPGEWIEVKLFQDGECSDPECEGTEGKDLYIFTEIFCSRECLSEWMSNFTSVKALVDIEEERLKRKNAN